MNNFKEFVDFENLNKLDDSLIQEINWWDICRHKVFNEFSNKSSNIKRYPNFFEFLAQTYNLCNSIIRPPNLNNSYDIVFVTHPRRVFINGKRKDIFSDHLIDALKKIDKKIICFEKPYTGKRAQSVYTESLFNLEIYYFLEKLGRACKKFNLTKFEVDYLDHLSQIFKEKTSKKVNFRGIVERDLSYFLSEVKIFDRLLKRISPKALFIVDSPSNQGIIYACKKNKVKTFEILHGSPIPGKLNYDYSHGIKKTVKPDYFLTTSNNFNETLEQLFSKDQIINIGQNINPKNIKTRKSNDIVYLSQPTTLCRFKELMEKATVLRNKKIPIKIKPHPSDDLPSIVSMFKHFDHVEVLDKQTTIENVVENFDHFVGFYSSALYEVAALGKNVFSIKNDVQNIPKKILGNLNIRAIDSLDSMLDLNYSEFKINQIINNQMFFNEQEFQALIQDHLK